MSDQSLNAKLEQINNFFNQSNKNIVNQQQRLSNLFKEINNTQAKVSAPYPSSSLIQPIDKTAFEITPFMEKVSSDPYKTFDINVLSEAQLATDSVFNYVTGFISPDLLSILEFIPEIQNLLSKLNVNLDSVLNTVNSYLPSHLDLESLIRTVGLIPIYTNLVPFLNVLSYYKISPLNITQTNMGDALWHMSNMRTRFSVLNYETVTSNTTDPNITTTYNDPFAQTALALTVIKANASNTLPISSLLNNLSIEEISKTIAFVNSVDSNTFFIITLGISILGEELSLLLLRDIYNSGVGTVNANLNMITKLLYSTKSKQILVINSNYNDVINNSENTVPKVIENVSLNIYNLGVSHFNIINDIYNTNKPIVSNLGDYFNYYGVNFVKVINDNIQLLTLPTVQTIIQHDLDLLFLQTPSDISNVLAIVAATSVTEYINTYGVGNYGNLLNDITLYGLIPVTDLMNATILVGNNKINIAITDISTLGNSNTVTLVNLANSYTDVIIGNTIYNLTQIHTQDLNELLSVIGVLGNKTTYMLITSNNTLSLANLKEFIKALAKPSHKQVINAIRLLSKLDLNGIQALTDNIKNTEVDYTFQYYNVTGNFLIYGLQQAIEICSKAGNLRMVINIFNNHKKYVNNTLRKTVITNLINYYKPNNDDSILSYKVASSNFINDLNSIKSNWLTVKRKGEDIINNVLFLNSDKELLTMLLENPITALPVKLQLDNQYKL